jgi:hypothetical protein
VLFALLAVPRLAQEPYRVIAQRAGVAHGTVGWVMAELPRNVSMKMRHRGVEISVAREAPGCQRSLRPAG